MATLRTLETQLGAPDTIYRRDGATLRVYNRSVRRNAAGLFFIGRDRSGKALFFIQAEGQNGHGPSFEGEMAALEMLGNIRALRCPLSHVNAVQMRELFSFARPVLLGLSDSFGFGDRLGIANPAHLRALEGSHMRPILAQQSIRELDRTQRTAGEVLDAASWAVFQEGYDRGFGADADHLKTTDDIDRYAGAGFTFYTFDPSAYVVNEAVTLPAGELRQRALLIESSQMLLHDVLSRYSGHSFRLEGGGVLEPTEEQIIRAFIKYGNVIPHAVKLYRHLKIKYATMRTEVELSVDETDIPTTPIEHLFIAAESKRLGAEWVSIAPRFIGDFEKGVDYRGDLNAFTAEYRIHAGIATIMGPYKISIHSGSDKFGVYRCIGSLRLGNVHVKTAGTSWLEALRTIAMADPSLLREILNFARDNYEVARQSYHVTGQLAKVPSAEQCTDAQLRALFDQHDARQALHVTFGQVLSAKNDIGCPLFRDRIMACLDQHEEIHYNNLIRHFHKHLDPFKRD